MRRTLILSLGAALAAHSGPAAAANMLTYSGPKTQLEVEGGGKVRLVIHKKEDSMLLQAAVSTSLGGKRPFEWPIAVWREAAERVAVPAGCGISKVENKLKSGATWQADFVCPPGVDLRRYLEFNKERFKAGKEPVQPPSP